MYSLKIIGQNEHTARLRVRKEKEYLSFKNVFLLWSNDAEFVKWYVQELINLDFEAFYWEHPALSLTFLNKPYECIIQRSKPLETLPQNEEAFKDYIAIQELVVDFQNLGKNARLVVPTQQTSNEIYNHLGKFIRNVEQDQIIQVFKRIGEVILEELKSNELIWLNTAGLGVIWLHVRMDTKPKYYKTKRYKDPKFLEVVK